MSEELREKLRALYEAAGSPVLRLIREERRHETPTSGVQNWSEARVDRPGNPQFAHCADDEDCELIVALVNALPALIDHLEADGGVEAMREAIEPFATFADTFIDEEGWSGPMRSERIVDWFGPSDFRRARLALSALPVLGVGR